MDQHLSKTQRTEEQAALVPQQQLGQNAREFASVEELIRSDAAQTPVPPQVRERLGESLAREPRPARPWWQRWFGRKGP